MQTDLNFFGRPVFLPHTRTSLYFSCWFLVMSAIPVRRANTDFAAQLSRGVAGLLQTCGDKDMSVWTVADEHLNKVIKVHKDQTSVCTQGRKDVGL